MTIISPGLASSIEPQVYQWTKPPNLVKLAGEFFKGEGGYRSAGSPARRGASQILSEPSAMIRTFPPLRRRQRPALDDVQTPSRTLTTMEFFPEPPAGRI